MATAMAEAFDTPMADSGDTDVSMYPTMATTDSSWLSLEASMSDDGFTAHATTFDHAQEGIEIEMGEDDEPITEYEMADEGGDYVDHEELQDIEVYDISAAPSPLQVADQTLFDYVLGADTDIMHVPSLDGMAEDLSSVATVKTITAFSTDNIPSTADPTSTNVVVPDTEVPQPAGVVHQEAPVDFVHGSFDGGDTAAELLGALSGHSEFDISGEETLKDGPGSEVTEPTVEPEEHSASSVENHDLGGDPLTEPVAVEQGDLTELETPGDKDPHEISEGVYIDPPPAVLLSLPPSAEFIECSLFNLPASSTPQSPSSSVKPDAGDTPHLLLHERPTLYYEPLSVVFTALRQEQCILNMPGFAEAELVIDAYDLQLSISEDNVYTHEVTLHELDVIHDGSDLSGPLRLRLKVIIPRFVTRYTTLRDQIARLNLTGDGDGPHTDSTSVIHQFEPSKYDAHPETDLTEQSHLDDDAVQGTSLGNTELQTDQTHTLAHGSAADDAVQQYAGLDALAEIGVDGAQDGEGATEDGTMGETENQSQALVHDTTEDAEPEFEGTEGNLDADEVHQHVAEDGGDYVEYAEFLDDDEQFDQELPGEFGDVAEVSDLQTNAAEGEQTSFVADEYEGPVEEDGIEEHYEVIGLHTNTDTDNFEHSNSTEAESRPDDSPPPSSKIQEQENSRHDSDTSRQEKFVSEDDGLNDNWDDVEEKAVSEGRLETLSRKSSTTTLASRTSKRAYEAVDLDDFDDDVFNTAASSPDAKRLRVQ